MNQPELDKIAGQSKAAAGPVECLGMTFESDQARREHFTALLREKLKNPEFRKAEGFPIGEDEAILAMSDPPYYTACPNPWLGEFVKHHGQPYDPKEKYHREPFAADVSQGKTHGVYRAHAYYTKVPHLAIVPAVLHYTAPGDVVLDGFCGTGMTGVAVQLCGAPPASEKHQIEEQCRLGGNSVPAWGGRRVILSDLAPTASFMAANYNLPFDVDAFATTAKRLLEQVEGEIGWMYETLHTDGKTRCRIDYTVWSEVYGCPECSGEVVFLEEALDPDTSRVSSVFDCPHCAASLQKSRLDLILETNVDTETGELARRPRRKPVSICYKARGKRYEKVPDARDLALIDRIEKTALPAAVPTCSFEFDDMWEAPRLKQRGITRVHHLFLRRPLIALAYMWELASRSLDLRIRNMMLFTVEQSIRNMSIMNSFEPLAYSQNARGQKSAYYVPGQHSEVSPWYFLDGKIRSVVKTFGALTIKDEAAMVSTGSVAALPLPDASVDYIFTDPPFGDNFPYAELNLLIESWHRVITEPKPEMIVDRAKKNRSTQKSLADYQKLMKRAFSEYGRVLKPGHWMTVVFSNTKACVWNAIQSALQEAGFVVANVSALDKQQGSFKAVTTPTAVKQDLVISAYKPSGQLELNFEKRGATEDGVWDFIREHLGNLPVVKAKAGELEFITERDPRILYDRTVAFYVRHGMPVPLSSPEFQASLADRFSERDGMYFLSEQAAEYDRKRIQMEGRTGQMSLFVEDERSAVDWLRNFLKERPSKYHDIQPEFFEKLNESWKKWETRPELKTLLDQYFLCYHGESDVPPQIHAHLSTDFHDLRNLPADSPALRAKARDRWFVPDPRKNADVERLREKRLLDEFWGYVPPGYDVEAAKRRRAGEAMLPGLNTQLPKLPKGKRLGEVRIEAVRIGFQHCFKTNDYATIVAVSRYIPADVIENDDQLQMIVDAAMMRSGLDE